MAARDFLNAAARISVSVGGQLRFRLQRRIDMFPCIALCDWPFISFLLILL